jgi:hypothetical protein
MRWEEERRGKRRDEIGKKRGQARERRRIHKK